MYPAAHEAEAVYPWGRRKWLTIAVGETLHLSFLQSGGHVPLNNFS